MATLVLPLKQHLSYANSTWFGTPNHFHEHTTPTVEAQHIYSVTAKIVYSYNITRYTGYWKDDRENIYSYVGPGAEPREEIATYWNWDITYRESATQTRFLWLDLKKKIYETREQFANKTLFKTEYLEFELTNQQEETLIQYINAIEAVNTRGFYQDDGEARIPTAVFPMYLVDIEHFYELVYRTIDVILAPEESCLIINYLPVGSIAAPTGAYAPASAPVQNVPLLWQEPQKTEQETWDVAITHYAIWRCDTVDGEYVQVGVTDGPVLNYSDTTATPGMTWYYKIQACSEEIPLYNSELSAPTAGTYVNHAPGAIAIETGQGGTTYNQRPRILATLGADADNVMLQLAAEGYTASRASAAPGERVAFIRTTAMETAGTEAVTITEADPAGNVVSADADAIYTVPAWTDVPVIAGTTVVKAVHINELRAQLENICDYYGMEAPVWSEDVVAGTTPSVRFTTHATELQNVVRAIANKINTWDAQSSRCNVVLPSLIEPQRPLASVINQLRDIIKIL